MNRRRLRIPDETARLIRSLHPQLKRKIKAALQTVLNGPDAGKRLKDELDGLRSFKVGKLRIVYRMPKEGKTVEIVAIGPRKTIYNETLRILQKE